MRRNCDDSHKQAPSKRPSPLYRVIWRAVRARKQMTCVYDGCYREVCPHILGYEDLGLERALVFQFGGDSTSKKLPRDGAWRCFDVGKMTDAKLRDGRWRSGVQHRKTQVCIQLVDVDVNVPATLKRRQPLAFGSPELRPPRRPGD